MILPCCNQSNQSVSRLISVPAAVKVDQEESVEFCDSHSSSAPFGPNVIWRLHTNPRRGKRLYQLFMVKIRYIRNFASAKLMTVGQLVNELGAGKIEPGWLIPHRSEIVLVFFEPRKVTTVPIPNATESLNIKWTSISKKLQWGQF